MYLCATYVKSATLGRFCLHSEQRTMVKFTLKLEDNRIEKWSSHYIDYKKLKQEINKLKNSPKNVVSAFTTCWFNGRRRRYSTFV